MYTENNLDALYGGGGGEWVETTAVMPLTGITVFCTLYATEKTMY